MENVASKRVSTRKRKTEKHIAPPATAEEIRRAVGVTKKDRAIVRKVMAELGYLGKPVGKSVKAKSETARKGSAQSRKAE
jgi:hypothetical protein